MLPIKDVLDQRTLIRPRDGHSLAMVHTPISLHIPSTVGILQSHTGSTALDLVGVAAVQREGLDLVIGQDDESRLSSCLLLNHLEVAHSDMVW